jgi:short-subunit dehydrogenase
MRVFITGASSGLGRALATHYLDVGANVGLAARREHELRALAGARLSTCHVYPLDVRDPAALQAAAEHYIATAGCPDVVIANAGTSVGTDSARAEDLQVFREIIDTNLTGTANTFQPFVSAMRAAGSGILVGIASVAGYRGLPGAAAYSASKAGVIAYLESLRVELRGTGVAVVTICPGYVETAMTAHNPYRMPFIMSAAEAAGKIAAAIERRRSYVVMPWQMAVVARVLRTMPNVVFDRLFARAPRKPRRGV